VLWGELLAETRLRLADAGVEQAEAEARWLVEAATGLDGAELVVVLDQPATQRGVAHLDAMVDRRRAGEPLQYVVGSWGFRSLDLMVDRRVLIPRPETETVVDEALAELDELAVGRPEGLRVVDLGTGSGAIALALAAERDRLEIWATDRSADALAVASANLAGLGRRGVAVRLVEGSWFSALPGELAGAIDLVVSNPPYVAATDPLPPEVRDWEPAEALVSGPSGLEAIEQVVAAAPTWLRSPGALVVELAPDQAEAAVALARQAGFADVRVAADLAGRPRTLVARLTR
jgi:release factor glutamine methyltransferase